MAVAAEPPIAERSIVTESTPLSSVTVTFNCDVVVPSAGIEAGVAVGFVTIGGVVSGADVVVPLATFDSGDTLGTSSDVCIAK